MPEFNEIYISPGRFAAKPPKVAVEDFHFELDGCRYVALDSVDVGVLPLLSAMALDLAFELTFLKRSGLAMAAT